MAFRLREDEYKTPQQTQSKQKASDAVIKTELELSTTHMGGPKFKPQLQSYLQFPTNALGGRSDIFST